jgi:hypothetical protein
MTVLVHLTEQTDRKSNSILRTVPISNRPSTGSQGEACMVEQEHAMVTEVDKTPF